MLKNITSFYYYLIPSIVQSADIIDCKFRLFTSVNNPIHYKPFNVHGKIEFP